MGVDQSLLGVPTFDTMEIVAQGTATITLSNPTDNGGVTIPHGLNFIPVPLVMLYAGGTYTPLPAVTAFNSGANNTVGMQTFHNCVVDGTNLYINFLAGFSDTWSTPINYKYYLFRIRSNNS